MRPTGYRLVRRRPRLADDPRRIHRRKAEKRRRPAARRCSPRLQRIREWERRQLAAVRVTAT